MHEVQIAYPQKLIALIDALDPIIFLKKNNLTPIKPLIIILVCNYIRVKTGNNNHSK